MVLVVVEPLLKNLLERQLCVSVFKGYGIFTTNVSENFEFVNKRLYYSTIMSFHQIRSRD